MKSRSPAIIFTLIAICAVVFTGGVFWQTKRTQDSRLNQEIKTIQESEQQGQGDIWQATIRILKKIEDRSPQVIQIGEANLQVEIVNMPASITLGLSGRSEIGSDGMLFILPAKQATKFWMKEMKFPLDMIWIADGKVAEITRDVPVPKPGQNLEDLPLFGPSLHVEMVLEVPAGDAQKKDIKVGDAVKL